MGVNLTNNLEPVLNLHAVLLQQQAEQRVISPSGERWRPSSIERAGGRGGAGGGSYAAGSDHRGRTEERSMARGDSFASGRERGRSLQGGGLEPQSPADQPKSGEKRFVQQRLWEAWFVSSSRDPTLRGLPLAGRLRQRCLDPSCAALANISCRSVNWTPAVLTPVGQHGIA